jgi:ferredoxin-NADP reductase
MLPTREIRQYSLCGDRWDPAAYRVGVLREPDGHGGSV